ncbi:MAG: Uma2 family endonuclease, partial [Microcystis sp.]
DKNALLSGNLAEVLARLQQGIASEQHQNFCQILANK